MGPKKPNLDTEPPIFELTNEITSPNQVSTHWHNRPEKMDREWGSKPGSGGAASAQNEAIDRRERLRRLALETIDLAKDPYFMRNHLGRHTLILNWSVIYFLILHIMSMIFHFW